jgi:hypothetical protein
VIKGKKRRRDVLGGIFGGKITLQKDAALK